MSDTSHGSYKSYITGFVLSVLLTAVPFWLVMAEPDIHVGWAIAIIAILGAIQVVVHMVYFLHVSVKAESGWQAMSLGMTVILLVIILAGSIWVMFHLNTNMMPAHDQIERLRDL
ncbi:cytochrome o ubiquinol oxidase subunit IV [Sulfitobacter sp.]|uniref:cytochrome o ubiquinol oxidase subunit IV n=1 Tax=Sulfitobacter sp. TaxID=1903071 RepID=UPI00329684B6